MAKNEEECARMRADMAEMTRILAGVEKGDEEAKKELMERQFQMKRVGEGNGETMVDGRDGRDKENLVVGGEREKNLWW